MTMAIPLPYLVASEKDKEVSQPHSHPCGKERGDHGNIPGPMKVRWCGNVHLNFTHVEQEGVVAMAILLLYLVPSEKGQKGGRHHSHSREGQEG